MATKELNNGRLAMIGIAGMVAQGRRERHEDLNAARRACTTHTVRSMLTAVIMKRQWHGRPAVMIVILRVVLRSQREPRRSAPSTAIRRRPCLRRNEDDARCHRRRLAEDRVLRRRRCCRSSRGTALLRVEEELRAAAVRRARVGHGDGADLVRDLADQSSRMFRRRRAG